jgi:pantoate--beta-alanine ligase
MKVIESIAGIHEFRQQLAGSIGFVPTMGYLHEGHLALVKQARKENDTVIVSIFVNPSQFGPKEDYLTYPRDTERDLKMLNSLTDVVFMPLNNEMYPVGFDTWIVPGVITERLEGAVRPGHFRGVATVVAKLFNIVRPTRAYFGQKDAQQLAVIRKMVADLDMGLEIIACPTVRESDGLAMSSRNIYLNQEQRRAAGVLNKALVLADDLWARGEREAAVIRHEMTELIEREPQADISYVSIADTVTLKEMLYKVRPPALVSLAVKFGKTRLIDNIILK